MDELLMSDDTVHAYTALADVLNKVVPDYRDEIVACIDGLIESRIADAIELLADKIQDASGVRP